jgi:hypothetical protein
MFTFETIDQKEVRRFRSAQFNGRTVTARAVGSTVTGRVHAIAAKKSSVPAAWVITIIPQEPKADALNLRPVARVRAFAEDFL